MADETTNMPGVLLRFRDGQISVHPCSDPLHDVPEAQQAGDIDLFKVDYSVFCQNSANFQQYFGLYPSTTGHLAAESSRSQFHCLDEYVALTLRYPEFESEAGIFHIHSTSMVIFGNRLLLLEPDSEVNLFDPRLTELLDGSHKNHIKSIAQLVNQMANAIFQVYTASLENFGDVLNKLENDIIDSERKTVFAMTALVRKQNIFLQQTILPLKEMSFDMLHAESEIMTPEMEGAMHNMSDQIQRLIDSAGMLSQINSGLLDIYANAQATRMNEIMRTLTVFSVLTIPISILTGFYGMNFVYLPLLRWKLGVPFIIALMILGILPILWFCKRKKII